MTTLETQIHQQYTALIGHASSTLTLLPEQIQEKYKHFTICCMNYTENEVDETILEIRLAKEQATLICTFGNDNRCVCSFLFPDCLEIDSYVHYFNRQYEYDFIKGRWILPNCYLAINRVQQDTCFIFCRRD